jgi:hypothetical protein
MKVTYGMGFTVTLVFDSALQRARWMASQGILSDLRHSDVFRVVLPEIPCHVDPDEQAPSTPHTTGSSQFATNDRIEQALQDAIPPDLSDAVEPETVSDADLDFPTDYTPTGDGGFFDPATGEVYDTLPSDADRERAHETPTLPSSPPAESVTSVSPSWDTQKWGTLGPPPAPSTPTSPNTEPLEDGKIEDGKIEAKRKTPKLSAEARTIPLPHVPPPIPNTGSLPTHVIPDLGQHPAITPAVDRSVILRRAVEDKLLDATLVESQPEAAWIALQYKAPVGWMKKTRESAAALASVCEPILAGSVMENMGALVDALAARGISVSLVTVAGWTSLARERAHAFLRGEVPDLGPVF